MSDKADYVKKLEKQFVDTNIIVYAHDVTAGEKNKRAKDLLIELWDTRKGCFSIQVLQEFYVTITKKVASPVKPTDAYRIISALSSWTTHVPKTEDILMAIDIQQKYNISFWDALIICSAVMLKCDVIWSEDLNNKQLYEGIIVLNPFEWQE